MKTGLLFLLTLTTITLATPTPQETTKPANCPTIIAWCQAWGCCPGELCDFLTRCQGKGNSQANAVLS